MNEGMPCKECGNMGAGMCKCPHHSVVPFLIVLIGVVFLLEALGKVTVAFTAMAWPILLILIGCQKLFKGICKCCCGPRP